ncbi:phage structural protein, partial [Enterococcus faecalis]
QSSGAKKKDNLGICTIKLSQNSSCNKQLMALANGRKEFAIYVTHSTVKAWASKAYIAKTPDASSGKGVPTPSYTLK